MKNRKKLRHMQIKDKEYLWAYYYDDMDFSNYPYSYYLFVPKNNKKLKVRVYFTKYEPQMNLNAYTSKGTICLFKGEKIELNLCRPYYARQVMEYIFKNCCADTDVGEINIENGEAILEKLGYSHFYRIGYEIENKI